MFSLVSPLPSTNSAGSGAPPLFAGFFGTMELCDSPLTSMSDLWPRAFSDRSAPMEKTDVTGVSRLPWGKFPTVLVVSDSVGGLIELAVIVRHDYCLPHIKIRSATSQGCFRSSIHRPVVPL